MLLDIRHETDYRYSTTANYSIQYARLMPRGDAGQRVLSWRVESPGRRWRQTDCYGNAVDVISVVEPHAGIRIVAHGRIETADDRGHLIRGRGGTLTGRPARAWVDVGKHHVGRNLCPFR